MKNKTQRTILAIFIMLSLVACGNSSDKIDKKEEKPKSGAGTVASVGTSTSKFQEIVPGSIYTGEIKILTPEASGTEVHEGNNTTIDASNTSEGYVMVRADMTSDKLKVIITHEDGEYKYDLGGDNNWEVYPLQMGNGSYKLNVYKNIDGKKYAQVYGANVDAALKEDNIVFEYPNQEVWYTDTTNAIKLSYDLCNGISSNKEKVQTIYDYIVQLLTYDKEKAATVPTGYRPVVDETLKIKTGICYDYAALLASMTRVQGIPTRLVMGYVMPQYEYHAWNEVYIDGQWQMLDSTLGNGLNENTENYTKEKIY